MSVLGLEPTFSYPEPPPPPRERGVIRGIRHDIYGKTGWPWLVMKWVVQFYILRWVVYRIYFWWH